MAPSARSNGVKSRQSILTHGMGIATAKGLQAVSIGALSGALGMSKSGVFAHFGSKRGLDLALVEAAAARFAEEVVGVAEAAPPGVARLVALTEAWLAQDPGGPVTLLAATPPRADGPLRDRVHAWRRSWHSTLADEVRVAINAGELASAVDPAQAAFEIDALLMAATRAADAGDLRAHDHARAAIERRLRHWAASHDTDVPLP